MATLDAISRLYENVLQYERAICDISLLDIKAGIQSMAHVYAPMTSTFETTDSKVTNFNHPASRCAYLHKYAPLHTYIAQDAMMRILGTVPEHFHKLLLNNSQLKICSLGGGPGSEAIGVLTALLSAFGTFHSSVTIIDRMKDWKDTVSSIMHELNVRPFRDEHHNRIWSYNNNCQWNYIECNLLQPMTNEVNESIRSASMITMVKFLSAAICLETENMVDRIFRVMKPGALVLFIDNAAGGFSQIVERAGKRNGLVPKFGPLRHVDYEAEALKINRFGYTSCYKTKVTIILLQKALNSRKNKKNLNSFPQSSGQNDTVSKSVDPVHCVVLNDKGKMENATTPFIPQQVIKKQYAVGEPEKPVSSVAAGRKTAGVVSNNSKPNSVRSSAVSNANNLSTKGSSNLPKPKSAATGQAKLNVPNYAKPESRFIDVNLKGEGYISPPRASQVINKPPAVVETHKPVSSRTVNRNKAGVVSNNSKPESMRSPAVSNANYLSTKGTSNLPKPKSSASGQTRLNVPNSAMPESRFLDLNRPKTSLTDNGFHFEQPRAVVPPKSPTRNFPTPDRKPRPDNLNPPIQNHQPSPRGLSQHDEPQRDVNDDSICCACCSIS